MSMAVTVTVPAKQADRWLDGLLLLLIRTSVCPATMEVGCLGGWMAVWHGKAGACVFLLVLDAVLADVTRRGTEKLYTGLVPLPLPPESYCWWRHNSRRRSVVHVHAFDRLQATEAVAAVPHFIARKTSQREPFWQHGEARRIPPVLTIVPAAAATRGCRESSASLPDVQVARFPNTHVPFNVSRRGPLHGQRALVQYNQLVVQQTPQQLRAPPSTGRELLVLLRATARPLERLVLLLRMIAWDSVRSIIVRVAGLGVGHSVTAVVCRSSAGNRRSAHLR